MKIKGKYYIRHLKLNILPHKTRSEKETAELIHKHNVLKRKHDIQDIKNDIINCNPFSAETYCQSDRRMELLKQGRNYLLGKLNV